jgi:hypothetical protein
MTKFLRNKKAQGRTVYRSAALTTTVHYAVLRVNRMNMNMLNSSCLMPYRHKVIAGCVICVIFKCALPQRGGLWKSCHVSGPFTQIKVKYVNSSCTENRHLRMLHTLDT